mgnify:CR=1 FL=1
MMQNFLKLNRQLLLRRHSRVPMRIPLPAEALPVGALRMAAALPVGVLRMVEVPIPAEALPVEVPGRRLQ